MQLTSAEVFDSLLYGPQSQSASSFFRERVDNLQAIIPQTFQNIYQDLREQVYRVTSSDFANAARLAANVIGNMWEGDRLKPLTDIPACQAATPIMRRWVMAQPDYRQMVKEQVASGYDGVYYDSNPGETGMWHQDYVEANIGIMHEDDEMGDISCLVYDSDHIVNEEAALSLLEKDAIKVTWDTVYAAVKKGELDPGNPFGGKF